MSPSHSGRAAAIARLAGIAATMAAAPAIAMSLAGPAGAAILPTADSTVVGAAAQAHLATVLDQPTSAEPVSADGVQHDAVPNPFHQFNQFQEGPFRQGQPFHQVEPFRQAPTGFVQIIDP
ncbi:hypothetical protein [Nocardia sp. alder85J]|uniref:hypothetical protein n=1 Tax=Nocardia sp. alder85J TaxID=2862949 RepID=UPI001CD27A55|nr:hypothetical protein [Nocardia sp. alder85J]MCX4098522.1 hypothetical protein [Nocardia sp. alder85J]